MLQLILDTILRKKQELILTREEQYQKLIRELAQGSEVDAEAAAEVLYAVGKDEHHFERDIKKDIENQQGRYELADQLKRKRELEKQLPKLQKELDSANEKLRIETAKLRELVAQKAEPLTSIRAELAAFSNVEKELQQSCRDPRILSRKTEIDVRRRELMAERQPLLEDLQAAKTKLSFELNRLTEIIAEIESTNIDWHRSKLVERKTDTELNVERYRLLVLRYEEPLKELDAELQALNDEFDDLNLQALKP